MGTVYLAEQRSVKYDWNMARMWLRKELRAGDTE